MGNILDLFGRILISTIFLLNGVFKISNYEGTVDWIESFGIPGILIIPAIILEIIGPILIIVGYKVKIEAGLLSLFCITLAGGFLIILVNGTRDFSIEKKFSK